MTSRRARTAFWLSGLALSFALGAVLHHTRQTRSALQSEIEAAVAALQTLRREASTFHQPQSFSPSAPSLAHDPAIAPPSYAEMKSALARLAASHPHRPAPPDPQSPHGSIFPELFADPEYVRLYAVQAQLNLDQRYAPFFARSTLAPETIAQLKHVLIQHQIATFEQTELVARHHVPSHQRGELSHLLDEKFKAELRQLLGEAEYAEFRRHEDTRQQRTVVNAFAQRLSYSDEPLQPGQATELIAIMASSTESHGKRRVPARKFTDDVLARARPILSPVQFDELQRYRAEQAAVERK